MTYRAGYFLINAVEKKYVAPWRKEQEMPKYKLTTALDNQIKGKPILTLYVLSSHLIPRPKEWGENIHMTGVEELVLLHKLLV